MPIDSLLRLEVSLGREPRWRSSLRYGAIGGAIGGLLGFAMGIRSKPEVHANKGDQTRGEIALDLMTQIGGATAAMGALYGLWRPGDRWRRIPLKTPVRVTMRWTDVRR